MAAYRTRDPMDAARFVRALERRGFRRVPAAHHWQARLEYGTFRVYRETERKSRSGFNGWIRIAFHELERGPSARPPAEPAPPFTVPQGAPCLTKECGEPSHSRGLCPRCGARWRYWNLEQVRESARERSRCRKAAERARRSA
jgi:hypothetical protein